ncbi:uncharacterized protein LOC143446675 [Clavelina lepadiformis]|uniref:uncharacterized protein LOC143446675 n=1 Tax=Clavelina lepadiformis TaxID=159417 RepID=UPI004042B5A2
MMKTADVTRRDLLQRKSPIKVRMRSGKWNQGSGEKWKRSTQTVVKLKIVEDLFLWDRTVTPDDPRLNEAVEAMTRIRDNTGFDPSLVKDKVVAAKMTRDLNIGLIKVKQIEVAKERTEAFLDRGIDAEKVNLYRRLNALSKNSSSTLPHQTKPGSECSKSKDILADRIHNAHLRMCTSLQNLDRYVSNLESSGGLLPPMSLHGVGDERLNSLSLAAWHSNQRSSSLPAISSSRPMREKELPQTNPSTNGSIKIFEIPASRRWSNAGCHESAIATPLRKLSCSAKPVLGEKSASR